MRLLDLSLETPHANVALDEALLDFATDTDGCDEVLRFWESSQAAVVVGRSSFVADEVNVAFCQQNAIPIVRRCSGGAAIVAGPGCLFYGLVLNVERRPELAMIDRAHREILKRMAAALRKVGIDALPRGTSDLAVGDKKISGNSLRRKRNWILYHGTILCGLSARLIAECLGIAPRQPDYRHGRSHSEFVTNVPVQATALKHVIAASWQASEEQRTIPEKELKDLMARRYTRNEWNLSR